MLNADYNKSGEKINYNVAFHEHGKKENDLLQGNVNLDNDNFLESEYTANSDELNKQVVRVKEIFIEAWNKQKKALTQSATEAVELNRKVIKKIQNKIPTYTEIYANVLKELPTIKNELASDKNLRNIYSYL